MFLFIFCHYRSNCSSSRFDIPTRRDLVVGLKTSVAIFLDQLGTVSQCELGGYMEVSCTAKFFGCINFDLSLRVDNGQDLSLGTYRDFSFLQYLVNTQWELDKIR